MPQVRYLHISCPDPCLFSKNKIHLSIDLEMQQDYRSDVKKSVCENNGYNLKCVKQLYGTVENNDSLYRKIVQEIVCLEC